MYGISTRVEGGGGVRVREVRLLWSDGGMHAGLYREGSGAISGPLDLRTLR